MAGQAHTVAGLSQHRVILGTVRIVATEAGHASGIHQTGREVVALHPVLVRCAVGEMCEGRFAELVILKLPEIAEVQADVKSDGPVIGFGIDRVLERPSLRMTLYASVVRVHEVETGWIDDRIPNGARDVCATGSMASLASDIPLGRRLGRGAGRFRPPPGAFGGALPATH